VLTGTSMKRSISEKPMISSKMQFISSAEAEDRAVKIDVLPAGQVRMKAGANSSRADIRPFTPILPADGSMIRVISLSTVLLPRRWAMMPTMSPDSIPKLTSRSAQNCSFVGATRGIAGEHCASDGAG